jgi:peptide methionine sulfoxide reductase MsrB
MGCASSTERQVASFPASGDNSPSNKNYPIYGSKDIMKRKANGTSDTPVQDNLRWGCDRKSADRICNHNRRYSERYNSFSHNHAFMTELIKTKKITFYDSNTGLTLFQAPVNRTWREFWEESHQHGWPSFRDEDVNWEQVRCLEGGEVVSLAGTHLGHNLPDKKGNRYCINLVSIAGRRAEMERKDGEIEQLETAPNPAET